MKAVSAFQMDEPIPIKLVKLKAQDERLLETLEIVRQAAESGECLGFCVVMSLTGREQLLAHYITGETNLNALVCGLERLKAKVISRFED